MVHNVPFFICATTDQWLNTNLFKNLDPANPTGKSSWCEEPDIIMLAMPDFPNLGHVACAHMCINNPFCMYFVHTDRGCSLRWVLSEFFFIFSFKKQMLQGANTDLFNPLVPEAHNSVKI